MILTWARDCHDRFIWVADNSCLFVNFISIDSSMFCLLLLGVSRSCRVLSLFACHKRADEFSNVTINIFSLCQRCMIVLLRFRLAGPFFLETMLFFACTERTWEVLSSNLMICTVFQLTQQNTVKQKPAECFFFNTKRSMFISFKCYLYAIIPREQQRARTTFFHFIHHSANTIVLIVRFWHHSIQCTIDYIIAFSNFYLQGPFCTWGVIFQGWVQCMFRSALEYNIQL